MDPLDAQQAGLHDAAMEQGHEEIALNLDDSSTSSEPGRSSAQARRRAQATDKALPPPTPSEAAFEAALRDFPSTRLRHKLAARPATTMPPCSSSASSQTATSICAIRTRRSPTRRASIQDRRRFVRGPPRRHRRALRAGAPLEFVRQPDNPHDPTRSPCTTATSNSDFSTGGSPRTSRRVIDAGRAIARASRR